MYNRQVNIYVIYMKTQLNKIFAIAALILLAGCGGPAAPGKYAEAAKCLSDKGVIMYGAYWCPHCSQQKKNFGDDFQFIRYQECDDSGVDGDHALCLKNGVTQYPTWQFPGQGNIVGEQQVRDLAKLANCQDYLPEEDQKLLEDQAATIDQANNLENQTTPAEVPGENTVPETPIASMEDSTTPTK